MYKYLLTICRTVSSCYRGLPAGFINRQNTYILVHTYLYIYTNFFLLVSSLILCDCHSPKIAQMREKK